MALRVALGYRCEDRDAGDVYARLMPGGLLCIHGVLREAGCESRLFNWSGVPWGEIGKRLKAFQPDVVGVSHFTHNHRSSAKLYEVARHVLPRAVILAGGPQATFLDDLLLARLPQLDGIVRGEGEIPMLEIARRHSAGEPWTEAPSLTVRTDGGIRRTADCQRLSDLDSCYPLARFDGTEGVNPEEQFPFLITSRGCPGKCTFCDSPEFWGRSVRFRSTRAIIDEIRYLMSRFGFLYFGFRDDTFTSNKRRVLEVCKAIETETPGILWNCQSRVDLVDDERLLAMKKAGCEQIQFGVESISSEILAQLGKPIASERVYRAVRWCRDNGIRSCAYFITGVPGQTAASLAAERRLFAEGRLQEGIVSPLCFYPGTSLFDRYREGGVVSEEIFLSGDVESLKVRRDPDARRLHNSLARIVAQYAPRNEPSETELVACLERTGRCVSALLDWGHFCLAVGRIRDARMSFLEIRHRFPRHPWGHQALGDLAQATGHDLQAEEHWAAARRAARSASVSS